jgi:hypothetical protein
MNKSCLYVRLGVGLGVLLLSGDNLSANDVLPDVVFLGQVEEAANLGCPLGSEALGEDGVGQSRDLILALLDNDNGNDSNIGAHDAATNGLALALTGAAGAVA